MSVLQQLPPGSFSSYFAQLHPASFNGIPFFTKACSTGVGRRNAEHVYPFRDEPWMEDIGRKARVYHITGFLVGDDVMLQRDRMQTALETEGAGVLVHPTYGRLSVSTLGESTFDEDMSHGRVIEVRFVFEESGQQIFPNTNIDTTSDVAESAKTATASVEDGYNAQITPDIIAGTFDSAGVSDVSTSWLDSVGSSADDSASLFNISSGSYGPFGRFSGENIGTNSGSIVGGYVSPSTIELIFNGLITTRSSDRSSLHLSLSSIIGVGSSNPFGLASSLTSIAYELLGMITNPSDAIRIFSGLCQFSFSSSPSGNRTADLCRRVSVIALARASSFYNPTSQDDADSIKSVVCDKLDAEITVAGDQGFDNIFLALSNLKTSVSKDMTARGAILPPLKEFKNNSARPSLVLAYQYYRDIKRSDELVRYANPIHPAFMPTYFNALGY